jgi:hypothetical protein
MQTINCAGAKFTPQLFIKLYAEARKLSPARFMTLLIPPNRYRQLYAFAEVPEAIQMGSTPGPLGRPIERVCCVKYPSGLGDGMGIKQDENMDKNSLVFSIHGQPELIVEGLGE